MTGGPSWCADCGHQHAGGDLAGICIGCPCQAGRPRSDAGLSADQVTFLLRCLTTARNTHAAGTSEYLAGWSDGAAYALDLVGSLLAAPSDPGHTEPADV